MPSCGRWGSRSSRVGTERTCWGSSATGTRRRTAVPRLVRILRRVAGGALRRLRPAAGATQRGEPLSVETRARFMSLGLTGDELDALDLREASIRYPDGWRGRNNRIYLAAGVELNPEFVTGNAELSGLSDVAVVLASPIDGLAVLGIHGDDASVYIGPE